MARVTPLIIDAGNSKIKVCTPSEDISEDQFDHIIKTVSADDYARVTARVSQPDPEYFIVNGVPYAIGEKAKRHGGRFERQHGSKRYTKNYYGVFVAISMARIFRRSVKNVFVMGSHAPKDVDYQNDLMEAAIGDWQVGWMGDEMTFKVVDASTFDEPLGGWANATLRKDGRAFSNKNINDGVTLVIDVGAFTTDRLVIDPGGNVDYSTADSETIGVLDSVEAFRKDIRTQNSAKLKDVQRISEDRIHEAIRTGTLDLRGMGEVPCQELARETRRSLAHDVYGVYERAGGASEYDNIILTGGGCALLEKELREMISHNNILLAEQNAEKMHMANVRGGMKWYKMHDQLGTFAV
jgi:hypothetical protein